MAARARDRVVFLSYGVHLAPQFAHDARALRFAAFALRASCSAALFAACFCSLTFRLATYPRSRRVHEPSC